MTEFDKWLESDEGVERFGFQYNEAWKDGARAGWDAAIDRVIETMPGKFIFIESGWMQDKIRELKGNK